MKSFFKISNIYILLWCLYYLQGTLYASGGIISQGILAILLAISAYYVFYVNFSLKTPAVIKALNVFILMLTFYGAIYWMSGEVIVKHDGNPIGAVGYLKGIYISLLPIYPFYAFSAKGLLIEQDIKRWFWIFLVIVTASYWRAEQDMLQKAFMEGSRQEEFTNNTGYSFLSLVPLLFFFREKRTIQYIALAYIMAYIIMGMKRGAILVGALAIIWFFYQTLKNSPRKTRFQVLFLTLVILIAAGFYIVNMYETSEYFQYRLEQTEEGATSGRDIIYATLLNYFLNDTTAWQFFFGSGANYTVVVAGNYAHNDWLELAVNQGCLGIVIYFLYWVCFFRSWQRCKNNSTIYSSLGALLMIFFLSTLFSMSYGDMSIYASLCFGYCLAQVPTKN